QGSPTPVAFEQNQEALASSQETSSNAPLDVWMHQQAGKIGQSDENPERTMALLKTKAEGLVAQDITDLERWALETDRNGDERFLAVELLIMNPRLESAESLGRILMTPEPSRAAEPVLENILRARAVEGLGSHPRREAARILRDSLYRVSDRSLIDRGERALVARKNASISPEEQDRKALKTLLKKTR
ncbi:MAG TPA: hypothetical protein PL182_04815, partial [Pseudobdellovibrionaceae bacterium]|nr:hypothetical protein [Pseudobdellovibrionaceae bacterium]